MPFSPQDVGVGQRARAQERARVPLQLDARSQQDSATWRRPVAPQRGSFRPGWPSRGTYRLQRR